MAENASYSALRNSLKRGERGIWEHAIRDDHDYENHMDYLHFNPVKHAWVDNSRNRS